MPKLNLLPKAREEYRARLSDLRLKDDEMPAVLGNGLGNDLDNVRIDQTHSWARIGESRIVMSVWNDRVPHINDWRVAVGYEPEQNIFRVLRPLESYLERPYSLFGEHGAAHSMFHPDGGHDIAWIDIRQWLPWRVFPSSTFTVSVWYGMAYRNGAWSSNEVQTLDLSASQPADGARYVLVTLDADGVLTATAGTAVADKFSLADSDIPAVPSGHYPLAVVRLYDTQTEIQEQRDDTDIIDLRYPPYTTMAPASASGGIAWENIIIVAKSGGDYTTIQAAINAATTGYTVLVAPGTYAENVTLKAGVQVKAIGEIGSVIVQPAAGVPLTLPASGQCVVTGIRALPPTGQVAVSFPAASTALFQLVSGYLDADGAASLDASAAAATAEADLSNCVTEGDVLLKAIGVIIDSRIGGNVTQSASAGNLTIDGGNIDGNLTHVAGSTITLRNLPRIAGTVSGTGTIVGAYLNSSGHIVFVNGTAMSGFANPTGLIGMAAVNGTATTATRSDATHAIDPAIAPTWTGLHTFSASSGDRAIYVTRSVGTTGAEEYGGYVILDATASQGSFGRYSLNVIAESSHTSGTVDITGAVLAQIQATGSGGTTANSASLETRAIVDTGATITTHQHLYIADASGAGALGTQYGIYIANLTKGSVNDYGIYVAGADTYAIWVDSGTVKFDGSLNIGTASGAATGEARASVGFAARVDGSGGGLFAGAASDVQLYRGAADTWYTGSGDSFYIGATAGIGTAPNANIGLNIVNSTRALAGQVSDAGTTNIAQAISIYHITSGTPAANFGVYWDAVLTTTSGNAVASAFYTQWVDATLATRKAVTRLYVYDTAARLYLTGEASGTAAMIGFLGAAAAIRQTGGAATAGATYTATEQGMLQKAYDALRTFGLLT